MKDCENTLWCLKNLDIFEGISDSEMMELAGRVKECTYLKDELIYGKTDELKKIYIVKRGEVRLYHSKEGKRTVFDVLGPGSVFGGIHFSAEKSSHFAQATYPTRVCIFYEDDFLEVLRKRPEIMLRFMRKMTDKIQDYEDRLKDRGASADELIMAELIRLQESRAKSLFGIFKPDKLHITHEELAELTGLNRVTVTRSLKRLREEGQIKVSKSAIELL